MRVTDRFHLQVWVVGYPGLCAHVEVVLDTPFRWQTVVIPPHGVDDVPAIHSLVANDQILMCVRKNMPHV